MLEREQSGTMTPGIAAGRPNRLTATGWSEPVPGGSSPAEIRRFSRCTVSPSTRRGCSGKSGCQICTSGELLVK